MGTATETFRAARDALLALHGQPERAVAEFTWPDLGPTFNWSVDWFDRVARGDDRPALVILAADGSRTSVTFDQMRGRAARAAVWLAEHGVRRGDPVMVMLGNQVELWEAVLGLMKLGAVVLPTTTALSAAGLRDRITRGAVAHVLCDAADTGAFEGVAGGWTRLCVGQVPGWADLRGADDVPDTAADALPHPGTASTDPLLRYFTSGTTAKAKLVEHSQVSYPLGHLSTMSWIGLQPGDVHLNLSSPGWAKHAWSSFFAPWNAQATVVCVNHPRFDAALLLAQLAAEGVTTFCAPPTVWRMLIGADLGSRPPALREVVSAGEPLNPEVIRAVRQAWGLTVRDGLGQTETTASVGNPPGAVVRPGSMGRPLPGVPVVVVDPATGEPAREGEICLDLSRAPITLMTGYRDAGGLEPARTGRWFHSGDLATVDDDGYLTYLGREDDVFKASDYKISPFELESVLLQHPAVAEAAVVPAPDPVRLAVPKACVALAPGHEPTRETALAILAHAREHLAPYQRIRRVEFVELPKTISGKIRRVELRQREADRAGRPSDGEGPRTEWRDDEFPELTAAGPR